MLRELSGWGRYPRQVADVQRPESYEELRDIFMNAPSVISRGMGRSYGDTALNANGTVINHQRLNRFLDFDPDTGTLVCEAGVSLKEILDVVVPQGYFLPVTPGTKYVTIGGAIACDVHGKNHHVDGTFSNFVEQFRLLSASGVVYTCSRGENPELFWATVGGLGLTGAILDATIRLIPIETHYVTVDYHRAKNLDHTFHLFERGDAEYKYSVAWIDCLSTGPNLGRSVVMQGNHTTASELPSDLKNRFELKVPTKRLLNIPLDFPSFTLNQYTIRAFNSVYYHASKTGKGHTVSYDSFFYPLDFISNWNRMYGKKGFIQYQVVLPPERSWDGVKALLERLSQEKAPSFLAVLKTFGPQGAGLLSFPRPGATLALDIPMSGSKLLDLIRSLDDIVIRNGGRVYLAKDSTLRPSDFRMMYPDFDEFWKIKRKLDPDNRIMSSMAARLGMNTGGV